MGLGFWVWDSTVGPGFRGAYWWVGGHVWSVNIVTLTSTVRLFGFDTEADYAEPQEQRTHEAD